MLEINPAGTRPDNNVKYTGRIEILKPLDNQNYLVKAGSREFTIKTDLTLLSGQILKGSIIFKGNSFYLFLPNSNQQQVKKQLPLLQNSNQLINNLLHIIINNTGKKPDPAFISILETLIAKKKVETSFSASLAGEAYLKGLKTENQISEFLGIITNPDQEKGRNQQKQQEKKQKDDKDIKQEIVNAVSAAENRTDLLFAFNHLKSSGKNWLIIPFNIGEEKNRAAGSLLIRILQDKITKIVIHAKKEKSEFFFELESIESNRKKLKIYANENSLIAIKSKNFSILEKKLHNLGVFIDDNISDIKKFSGLSEIKTSYSVDFKI